MKKIYYIFTFLLCIYVQTANAQMGVNSTGQVPDASAMLDVRSTNKGFLLPRLTTTQRNAMPAISNGLMIYNTTTAEIEVYRGFAGWVTASRMGVPFVVSGSTAIGSTAIIEATNTGTGEAIRGTGSTAVAGYGSSTGVYGETASGTGTFGRSDTFRGVWGRGITTGDGVYGDATTGYGVRGLATSTGTGVYGASTAGTGMEAYANNTAPSADYSGLYGRNKSTNNFGNGVNGVHDGSGDGVLGTSVSGKGVRGTGAQGIYGDGTTTGVFGTSTSGTGVFGRSNTFRGVWGRGITTGDGVYGDAINGRGVYGETSGSGTGVAGYASASGTGVTGYSNTGYAGFFQSGSNIGLYANSSSNIAIQADNTSATIPVAQFANLSGGTALELVASTALKITGAIKVVGGITAQPAFKITTNTAVGGNTSANYLTIPNTTLANSSNDILIVTHNYSPNSTYLNKAYGVFWSPIIGAWNIYLEDVTSMPNNVTFNVLVIKQ